MRYLKQALIETTITGYNLRKNKGVKMLVIPKNYKPKLSLYETQIAIGKLKRFFEDNLSRALNLKRVSAPLFVEPNKGINDDLSGIERAVEFDIQQTEEKAQVVQSLAKWKRVALEKYGFPVGEGIYADMNAIRRDDVRDNIHSIYVDQWDWEKVIDKNSRNETYLEETVTAIVNSIFDTSEELSKIFPITQIPKRDVYFITSQELEYQYPTLSSKERENACAKEHKIIFIKQIGGNLRSGKPHDSRAPDYDDWTLNGDILFWCDILNYAIELSSMGIRVDSLTLNNQLELSGLNDRRELMYHKMLLNNQLPYTIGGGIGQSRLSMLLLQKAHIGEVQVSVWDKTTIEACNMAGIQLL